MSDEINQTMRRLPSVDRLLQASAIVALIERYGRELVVETIRETLDVARAAIRAGAPIADESVILASVAGALERALEPSLRRVINAAGVILHTNLGRAPLSAATRQAMAAAGEGYSNLEYDLQAGRRGSRYVHAEELLRRLTGAEAALVVNNNAGAVLLALSALARGREVIISRSQLIEIGGGFRIPEVMEQSGARLVEVGTTNRTRLADFERAITPATALLMRAHPSNFRIVGFTEEPALADMARLAQSHALPLLDDLGSGTLLDTAAYGLAHEPTVQESLAAGATLVTFSGDKLLGGPQAGVIVGRQAEVERLRRFPLTRALRVDKVTLAGVQANLLHYLRGEATREVPVWRMIARSAEELRRVAESWAAELARRGLPASIQAGQSAVGGGALPGSTLPTWHVALAAPSPDGLAARLRAGRPAVIATIQGDQLLLDPRTVQPDEEDPLLDAVSRAYAEVRAPTEAR